MTDEINTNIALETPTEQVVEAQPTSIQLQKKVLEMKKLVEKAKKLREARG